MVLLRTLDRKVLWETKHVSVWFARKEEVPTNALLKVSLVLYDFEFD